MPPQNTRHVLVVEDEPPTQRALQRLLRDCTTTITPSVEGAIDLLKEGIAFDVVITDYDLAGVQTGKDLINWIRANRPDMLSKTILFSGNDDAAEIHPHFVMKPAMAELRIALIQLAD